jgi:hypothetical protein
MLVQWNRCEQGRGGPAKPLYQGPAQELARVSHGLLPRDRAPAISLEMAQMLVSGQEASGTLPDWFMVEIVRDLPRLVEKKDAP